MRGAKPPSCMGVNLRLTPMLRARQQFLEDFYNKTQFLKKYGVHKEILNKIGKKSKFSVLPILYPRSHFFANLIEDFPYEMPQLFKN